MNQKSMAQSPVSLFRAVCLMMLAIGVYASQDLLIKLISEEVSLGQIIFFRSTVSFIPIVLMAFITRTSLSLKTQQLSKHFFRALLAFVALLCFVSAFIQMPLAQAYTLTFTAPLFMTGLSWLWLKEPIDVYRWGCVCLGFVGVWVVANPDIHFFTGASFVTLLGGLAYAGSLLFIRDLNRTDSSITILLFFTLVSMVLGALLACFTWTPLSSKNFQILFGIGILGGTAQCLMTQAFCMVPASVLAPFDYIALLWGLALDYYLFHCMPTLSGLVGAGFIMAAGGLMLFHEKKKLG